MCLILLSVVLRVKEIDWFLNLAGIVNNRQIKFHEITKHALLVAFRDYTSGVILY